MNSDLKIIKKKYGEEMMHLCRELFPTLLENEGLLSKLMLDHFHPNHDLYDDIINSSAIDEFKSYIYSFIDVETHEEIQVLKTPAELLSEVGYHLFECKTYEDVENFKKYYYPGEELCTFRDIEGRLKRYHIFFAVKKNVDTIHRKDFLKPQRQDLYGTSVMSLQFTKDSAHTLSIKNRYNHSVNNPDSTFSNNLDNIVGGLTESFEREYSLYQKYKSTFEIPNYVMAHDGKYYKYNYEIGNIYYCNDNVIIDNFEAKVFAKERYIVLDYFILDMQDKKMKFYDTEAGEDSFVASIGEIKQIVVERENKDKKIIIMPETGENIEIILNKDNQIIGLTNSNVEEIRDKFLYNNQTLTSLNIPNLQEVGDKFLYNNRTLTSLNLPNLQEVGDKFLYINRTLTSLNLPNLQEVGNDFLEFNPTLTSLNLPNLREVGDNFFYNNRTLPTLNLPNLQKIGDRFLYNNRILSTLNLPNVQEVGNCFLVFNQTLTLLNIPNLQKIGIDLLTFNQELRDKILEQMENRKRR